MRSCAALIAIIATAGCNPASNDPRAPATWVGTITTEGNVTTVVTESGSVWGGDATLVEEASIGVAAGPDAYLFGAVSAVWATDDRIFVLDWQVPVVRVFDLDGTHQMDIGRGGQGPGEFNFPSDLVVTRAGEVLVIDRTMKVHAFDLDGRPLPPWLYERGSEVGFGNVWVLGLDDVPWVPTFDDVTRRVGRVRLGPDGAIGALTLPPELEWERGECLSYSRRGQQRDYCGLPYRTGPVASFTPAGEWVVGINDRYRFEVHDPDGSLLVVERTRDPVAVEPQELAHHERAITERLRRDDPSWSWNGPGIPVIKPAYEQLVPDRSGRTWALREKPSRRSTRCDGDQPECWRPSGYWLDAFGRDGRLLGTVSLPRRPLAPLFIRDETLIAVVMDDAGTIVVKRYRLVSPEAPGS